MLQEALVQSEQVVDLQVCHQTRFGNIYVRTETSREKDVLRVVVIHQGRGQYTIVYTERQNKNGIPAAIERGICEADHYLRSMRVKLFEMEPVEAGRL